MRKFTVGLDNIKLQVDLHNLYSQRELFNKITYALTSTYSNLFISYDTNTQKRVLSHSLLSAGKKIMEINTGTYTRGHRSDKNRVTIFYITIELAGMKRYNDYTDTLSVNCLKRVSALFNSNNIRFDVTGVDLYVDVEAPFTNLYAIANRKASGVAYYGVNEPQPYASTFYIEKYNNTHTNVMKRAYLYDKGIKDNLLYTITRFELKLQTRFFSKNRFTNDLLQEQLDKYHILLFPTLEEKSSVLSYYAIHHLTTRRRDFYKLELERYRLLPDASGVESFIFELYNIYEHDLRLPMQKLNSEFFR